MTEKKFWFETVIKGQRATAITWDNLRSKCNKNAKDTGKHKTFEIFYCGLKNSAKIGIYHTEGHVMKYLSGHRKAMKWVEDNE